MVGIKKKRKELLKLINREDLISTRDLCNISDDRKIYLFKKIKSLYTDIEGLEEFKKDLSLILSEMDNVDEMLFIFSVLSRIEYHVLLVNSDMLFNSLVAIRSNKNNDNNIDYIS